MGRKTYESIGKPLPKRMTIVLTRQKNFQANGCLIADTIERALELAKSCKDFNQEEIFIAGGGEIYSAFLPLADFLYISEVESSLEADTYFPPFSDEQWELVKITQYPEKKDCFTWSFKVFKRN
jgi:dihydrofolate reductase